MEITRIENKPGQVLPDSAATPAGEPTGEDLVDFGAWSKEQENRLWEQHPPKPEDFGMADTPVQHVGGITAVSYTHLLPSTATSGCHCHYRKSLRQILSRFLSPEKV